LANVTEKQKTSHHHHHHASRERSKEKQSTAILSSVVNIVLVLFKFIVGYLSGSISIVSEALHSLVDLAASLIAYFAVRSAEKPATPRYAYGHGKLENISGAAEAILIVLT
jgi:cation diffusion facilitator family transporter